MQSVIIISILTRCPRRSVFTFSLHYFFYSFQPLLISPASNPPQSIQSIWTTENAFVFPSDTFQPPHTNTQHPSQMIGKYSFLMMRRGEESERAGGGRHYLSELCLTLNIYVWAFRNKLNFNKINFKRKGNFPIIEVRRYDETMWLCGV